MKIIFFKLNKPKEIIKEKRKKEKNENIIECTYMFIA